MGLSKLLRDDCLDGVAWGDEQGSKWILCLSSMKVSGTLQHCCLCWLAPPNDSRSFLALIIFSLLISESALTDGYGPHFL